MPKRPSPANTRIPTQISRLGSQSAGPSTSDLSQRQASWENMKGVDLEAGRQEGSTICHRGKRRKETEKEKKADFT